MIEMDELENSIAALEKARGQLHVKKPGHGKTIAVIAIAIIAVAALLALAALVVVQAGLPEIGLPSIPEIELPDMDSPVIEEPEAPTALPVDAFPLTGSYVCTVTGNDYHVYEESYFYLEGENLAIVGDGQKLIVTPGRRQVREAAAQDFFVFAPGVVCIEDGEPERIMEEAGETGIIAFGGTDYVVEPGKVDG
ncbi:hypothetical protein ACFLQ2_01355 [archaeon]